MRGDGATTRQMVSAPKNAFFVWCNSNLGYPKDLAHFLGRDDLKVIAHSELEHGRTRGTSRAVVVDHAARLNYEQVEELRWVHTGGK